MTTRRDFIKTSGFLVVGFSVAGVVADLPLAAQGAGPYPDVDFRQLDSWIVIREDNTATFFVGKTDLGQGTGTAFRQVMADELDLPYDKTSCVMGNTDVTVDQGGSGGSDALQTDGYPMRRVAAEARRVLLEMASARLGVPVAQLVVTDGVVAVAADSSKLTQFMSGITRYAPESVFPTVTGWPKQSIRDHRRVIAEFERRDANRARMTMAEHFTMRVAPLTDHLIERGVITDGESQAQAAGRS